MDNQFTASLWGDEGFSAVLSMKSIPEILEIISRDTSPPLYNLTEHLAFQLFGTSEVVIRGLSFLYYLIAIFFVYKITSFLWGRYTGILASLLAFFNPFFFIYAFEGRMYSIMAAGVAASFYFLVRITHTEYKRSKKRQINWHVIGYALSVAWALYSHHFAMFVIILQGLWMVYEFLLGNRKASYRVFVGLALAGLLYLPWVPTLIFQTKLVKSGFWLATPTTTDFRNLIYDYFAKVHQHKLSEFALWLVFIILGIRKWQERKANSALMVLWFIFPIALTWIVSQFYQAIFYNRYLLYAIPGLAIILASNRRKIISDIALFILLGLYLVMAKDYFYHPTKQPFKELAQYVEDTRRGDDFVVNYNHLGHYLWESKYYKIDSPIYYEEQSELPFFVGTALMTEADIIHVLPKGKYRIGLITKAKPEEVKLPPGYTLVDHKSFGEAQFMWYQNENYQIKR
jgi:mannosyltransferase